MAKLQRKRRLRRLGEPSKRLRISLHERWRNCRGFLLYKCLEHCSIGDGLSLVVVVRHYVSVGCAGIDLDDSLRPGLELLPRVEIVVTSLDARVLSEPVLVVASVNPDVPDAAGHRRAGLDAALEERLIDVDESYPALRELGVELRSVPRFMSHLEHERKLAKGSRHVIQPLAVFVRAPERPGKLQQQGPQTPGAMKPVHRHAGLAKLGACPRGFSLVSKALAQLRRELEMREGLDARHPLVGSRRKRRAVVSGVYLDGGEIAGDVGERIEPLRFRQGIHDSFPILVEPARRSVVDHAEVIGNNSAAYDRWSRARARSRPLRRRRQPIASSY